MSASQGNYESTKDWSNITIKAIRIAFDIYPTH